MTSRLHRCTDTSECPVCRAKLAERLLASGRAHAALLMLRGLDDLIVEFVGQALAAAATRDRLEPARATEGTPA